MRIVVIGGGLAGMASAARLAKLGHQVTLLEQRDTLGGALSQREQDGFRWDAGPSQTLLPAVLRDLFRKSGRPLEAEFDLANVEVIREHRFADGSSVQIGSGRASQLAAFDSLAPGLGTAWVDHVAQYGDIWDALRRDYLERPWQPTLASARSRAALSSRRSLASAGRDLGDPRLQLAFAHDAVRAGQDPRRTPSWWGLTVYLEQKFGAWTHPDGLGQLAEALRRRLTTRKVEVRTGTVVRDVLIRGHVASGVLTEGGVLEADAVVLAGSPTQLPSSQSWTPKAGRILPRRPPRAAQPAHLVHLGLAGSDPPVAHRTVIHTGAGPAGSHIELHTGGSAPAGCSVVTLTVRGIRNEDPVALLGRHGIDLKARIRSRLDVSPRDQLQDFAGSPWGQRWTAPGASLSRPGPTTSVAGLFLAGGYAAPGPTVPFAGLSAALVAQLIGPAERPGAAGAGRPKPEPR